MGNFLVGQKLLMASNTIRNFPRKVPKDSESRLMFAMRERSSFPIFFLHFPYLASCNFVFPIIQMGKVRESVFRISYLEQTSSDF